MSVSSAAVAGSARRGLRYRERQWLLGYALIIPAFAFVAGLIVYPAAWGVYFAFTDKVIGQTEHWVGFGNFIYMLQWPDFGLMIWNTILLTVVAVAVKAVV